MSFQTEQESPDVLHYDWHTESELDANGTVIKNVLLCGNKSRNGYDIPGSAFGTEQRAKQLYEHVHVFVDHPDSSRLQSKEAAQGRPSRELAGWVENVRLVDGKPRGDIHTEGCPCGQLIRDFANAHVPNVGLSHVAKYKFDNKARRTVESVQEVCSVDVVIRPATTNSFTEQTRMADENVLQTENSSLKDQVASLKTQLTAEQEKSKTLDSRCAELKTENEGLKTEVNGFKQREAVIARRKTVETEITAAGLDLTDTDICSPVFIESLVSVEKPEDRKLLIDERVAIAKRLNPESTGGNGSGERQKPGSQKKDIVSEVLNSGNLFA